MQDKDIDLSDIPEVTEDQMARAKLRIGGKPVAKGKVRVNIFLDAEVVAYFKAKAGGRGYQTLINEALKAKIRNHELETILRRVIREELQADGHQVKITRIDAKSPFRTEIGTAFELNRLLSKEVKAAVGDGMFPMVLSGNCNSCLGTIAGINSSQQGVVWFDAHGEFNTPETTQSGFLDGMPLAMATGRCWKAILKTIPGFVPVKESNVISVLPGD